MPKKLDHAAALAETGPRRSGRNTPSRHDPISLPGSPYTRPGSAATLAPPYKSTPGGTRVDPVDPELYAPSSPSRKAKGKQPLRGMAGVGSSDVEGVGRMGETVAEKLFAKEGLKTRVHIKDRRKAEKREWVEPPAWKQPSAGPGSIVSFATLSSRALNVSKTFPSNIKHLPLTFKLGEKAGEGRAVVSKAWGARLKGGRGFLVEDEVEFVGPGGVAVAMGDHVGGHGREPVSKSDGPSSVKLDEVDRAQREGEVGSKGEEGSGRLGPRSGVGMMETPADDPDQHDTDAAANPSSGFPLKDVKFTSVGQEAAGSGGEVAIGEEGMEVEAGGSALKASAEAGSAGDEAEVGEGGMTGIYAELNDEDVRAIGEIPEYAVKLYLVPPGQPDELRHACKATNNVIHTLPPNQTTVVPILLQGSVLVWSKERGRWEAIRWTALVTELFEPLVNVLNKTTDDVVKERLIRSFALRVAELNRAGWSGRDIKLDNGVVRPDGTVSLIDLGTAIPIGQNLPLIKIGSLPYIGPTAIARILYLTLIQKEAALLAPRADGQKNDWLVGGVEYALPHRSAEGDSPMTHWKTKMEDGSCHHAEPDQDGWATGASILESQAPTSFKRLCKKLGLKVDRAERLLNDGCTQAAFRTLWTEIQEIVGQITNDQVWEQELPQQYHSLAKICFGHQVSIGGQGRHQQPLQTFGPEMMQAIDPASDGHGPVTQEAIALAQEAFKRELETGRLLGTESSTGDMFTRSSIFASRRTRLRPNAISDPFSTAKLIRTRGQANYGKSRRAAPLICAIGASRVESEVERRIDFEEPAEHHFFGFSVSTDIYECVVPDCWQGSGKEGGAFEFKRWDDMATHLDGQDPSKLCTGLRGPDSGPLIEVHRWKWNLPKVDAKLPERISGALEDGECDWADSDEEMDSGDEEMS